MAAYVCPSAVKLWRSYILTPLCGGGRRLRFLAAYKTPNPARGNRRDSLTVQIHLFLMNHDHSEIASAHFGQLVCGWTSASNQPLVLQGEGTFSVVRKLLLLHLPSLDPCNFLFRHEQKKKHSSPMWVDSHRFPDATKEISNNGKRRPANTYVGGWASSLLACSCGDRYAGAGDSVRVRIRLITPEGVGADRECSKQKQTGGNVFCVGSSKSGFYDGPRDHLTLQGALTMSQPPAVKGPPKGFTPACFSTIAPLLVKSLLAHYDRRHQARWLRHSAKIYRASSCSSFSWTLYSLELPLSLHVHLVTTQIYCGNLSALLFRLLTFPGNWYAYVCCFYNLNTYRAKLRKRPQADKHRPLNVVPVKSNSARSHYELLSCVFWRNSLLHSLLTSI